jgi:integrase
MRRFTLGTYPEMGLSAARSAARALHVEVKLRGADPIAERREQKARAGAAAEGIITLIDLLNIYGEKVGVRKKSWGEARRRVENVFRSLVDRPLAGLSRAEIQIIADGHGAVMSGAAAVRYLRPILKWGFQRGYVSESVLGLQTPAPTKRRKRVLSEAELARILPVLQSSERPAWLTMSFILLTLARREEAAGATWQDVDWASRTWTIVDTKSGEPHVVPLSNQALELLKRLYGSGADPKALIFSTKTGGALGNWDRETKALHEVTSTSDWHRHDLRRTAATILGNLGELPDIIEAALNHADIRSSLAATYNRSRYRPQVKQALQRLADYLDGITAGESGKILALQDRIA